jgi:hypothetical protein
MTTENPQFAFSYEFIATESGLKAVEVPKAKKRKASTFTNSKPIKRKLVDLLILYLCK